MGEGQGKGEISRDQLGFIKGRLCRIDGGSQVQGRTHGGLITRYGVRRFVWLAPYPR
jgi:hypothetical protein